MKKWYKKILKFLIEPIGGKYNIRYNIGLLCFLSVFILVPTNIYYKTQLKILSNNKNYYVERYNYWKNYQSKTNQSFLLNKNKIINQIPNSLTKETKTMIAIGITNGIKNFNWQNNKLKYKWLTPEFILSVIIIESRFNPTAISHVGAIGLMQIKPSTAKWFCKKNNIKFKNLYDPEFNVYIGTAYLVYLADLLSKEIPTHLLAIKVLVAYNEGPNSKAIKYSSIKLCTHKYVRKFIVNI